MGLISAPLLLLRGLREHIEHLSAESFLRAFKPGRNPCPLKEGQGLLNTIAEIPEGNLLAVLFVFQTIGFFSKAQELSVRQGDFQGVEGE